MYTLALEVIKTKLIMILKLILKGSISFHTMTNMRQALRQAARRKNERKLSSWISHVLPFYTSRHQTEKQERREPNVGPGPAQI